jgi:hypothetical protein
MWEMKRFLPAQIWCRTIFTHRMCNGYTFDSPNTLIDHVELAQDVDLDSLPAVIERLCSCTCHDRTAMHLEEPERFVQAARTTKILFGTGA